MVSGPERDDAADLPGPRRPGLVPSRELNRALLARQLLLERAELPIPDALERVGGIQAQYAPSMYIGLWSRLGGFERDDLTRALEERDGDPGHVMRVTIHLVSRGLLAAGARGARGRRSCGCAPVAATPSDEAMQEAAALGFASGCHCRARRSRR